MNHNKEKFNKLVSELKRFVGDDTLYYNAATCKFEIYKDCYNTNKDELLMTSDVYFPDFYVKE